jgi:hypothetical protein
MINPLYTIGSLSIDSLRIAAYLRHTVFILATQQVSATPVAERMNDHRTSIDGLYDSLKGLWRLITFY